MAKNEGTPEERDFLFYAIKHISKSDRIKCIEIIPFTKGDGVSCKVPYPASIAYRPRIDSRGDVDEVMLVRVMVYGEEITKKRIDIDVSKFSQCWYGRTEPSPACENKKTDLFRPLDIELDDIGIFDAQNKLIYDKKGQLAALTDLIYIAINLHLVPTYRIKGFLFRLRVRGKIFRKFYLSFIESFLLLILKWLGKSMSKPYDIFSTVSYKIDPYQLKIESSGSREIQMYGYSVPVGVIFVVSCITIIMAILLPKYVNLITGAAAFLILALIFNECVPQIIRLLICNIRKVLLRIPNPVPRRFVRVYF